MPEQMPRQYQGAGGNTLQIAAALVIVSFVLGILYLGRMILEPLAMAVLLAFVLTPLIRRLRSWGIGRAVSVIAVVVFALCIIGLTVLVIESEFTGLAGEIPTYQKNLQEKIASLNRAFVSSGTLKRASSTLNSLASELKGQEQGTPAGKTGFGSNTAPVPVEVHSPKPAIIETLQSLLGPLITPLTMGALLILFLVFILFYREDLRDRILRLGGTRDLQRTTEAMNDAGRRLSRFFIIQAAINASFGVFIGAALWALGVPNSVLWGVLAAILRFVPYIGTPMAAVFPLVLAAAIDPGWGKVLATAAVFAVSELITGQAIEPVLQGQQTGLSPLAIVLSQLFWTSIWGVPGLLMAVPVTVCVAVLARHIDALNFLGIVLGDEPALAPHEGFYQRLLAGDAIEAAAQAEKQLATEPLSHYYDAVPMKALALAHSDAAAGKLSEDRQSELLNVMEDIVEDLADYSDEPGGSERQKPSAESGKTKEKPEEAVIDGASAAERAGPSILLIAARSPIDQCANLLLAHVLRSRGLKPSLQPYSNTRRRPIPTPPAPRLVFVSCFNRSEAGEAAVRFLIRRLRRSMPEARFLASFWLGDDDVPELEKMRSNVGADYIAASVTGAAAKFNTVSCAITPRQEHACTGAVPADA